MFFVPASGCNSPLSFSLRPRKSTMYRRDVPPQKEGGIGAREYPPIAVGESLNPSAPTKLALEFPSTPSTVRPSGTQSLISTFFRLTQKDT